MKIVADENIPLLDEFFAGMCQSLQSLPGREMTADDVKDADVLLVRSITQVNEALLAGSQVKFVGTCTIGTDHLDCEYLTAQNIQFNNAPGCNAQAVVEYVLSAMVTLGEYKQQDWLNFTVGIVGVGNVGSRLNTTLMALGIQTVCYDPNVEGFNSEQNAQAVWQQDVVTLHTPITRHGEYATYHLVDEQKLSQMKTSACLINSCRGAVVENQVLLTHLNNHSEFSAVMDVWEEEPSPSDEMIKACLLATPHIAGYSLDGKYNGTAMIYEKLCEFYALPKRLKLAQLVEMNPIRKICFSSSAPNDYSLKKCIRASYDIRDDHFRMQRLLGLSAAEKANQFDALRKHYPLRRELAGIQYSRKPLAAAQFVSALAMKYKD